MKRILKLYKEYFKLKTLNYGTKEIQSKLSTNFPVCVNSMPQSGLSSAAYHKHQIVLHGPDGGVTTHLLPTGCSSQLAT